MRRVVAHVSGHVQGVGYRWFVSGLARRAGLTGYARNLSDRRVEVALEGEDDAVSAVLAALDGQDAPGAVTSVDSRDEPVRGGSGFTTE
ncbi:acylphosphatase [Blastococcus haudaquaticus]|uniref:acylphosphatase n=1 Tax=Blastococcus haudaquaticus TaxID=1938745 RepID=A0A286GBZ0_9ACTN|nr:acylphosphatase [Blastococcus haudaquaticus]SOD93008.1 acylphosphatase [Blastococcus haudaquaticus]